MRLKVSRITFLLLVSRLYNEFYKLQINKIVSKLCYYLCNLLKYAIWLCTVSINNMMSIRITSSQYNEKSIKEKLDIWHLEFKLFQKLFLYPSPKVPTTIFSIFCVHIILMYVWMMDLTWIVINLQSKLNNKNKDTLLKVHCDLSNYFKWPKLTLHMASYIVQQ